MVAFEPEVNDQIAIDLQRAIPLVPTIVGVNLGEVVNDQITRRIACPVDDLEVGTDDATACREQGILEPPRGINSTSSTTFFLTARALCRFGTQLHDSIGVLMVSGRFYPHPILAGRFSGVALQALHVAECAGQDAARRKAKGICIGSEAGLVIDQPSHRFFCSGLGRIYRLRPVPVKRNLV